MMRIILYLWVGIEESDFYRKKCKKSDHYFSKIINFGSFQKWTTGYGGNEVKI